MPAANPSLGEIKPGDDLVADAGFTCLAHGEVVRVGADAEGRLFVPCSHGHHVLDGQVDDEDRLVGLSRPEA